MIWTVEGKHVHGPNGVTAEFEEQVKDTLAVGDILVVLLEVPPNKAITENVYGVSVDGKLLWQIERIPETSTNTPLIPVAAYDYQLAADGQRDSVSETRYSAEQSTER